MSRRSTRAEQVEATETGWFAVGDSSALRIISTLTLGESDTGALAINHPHPERQWVELVVDDGPDIPHLTLLRRDLLMLPAGGHAAARYPIGDGLTLALPHNTLRICRDMVPPVEDAPRVEVKPRPGRLHAAPHPPPRVTLDENEPADPAAGSPHPVPRRRNRPVPQRRRMGPILLATATGVIAGLAVVQLPQFEQWILTAPVLTAPAQPPDAVARTAPGTEPFVLPLIDVTDTPGETFGRPPGQVADDAAAAAELADTGVPEPAAAVSLSLEEQALLQRAAQLLDEGEITMPPGNNAVALLQRVLEAAPDHPEARAMLEQCSEHLVNRANTYRQRGKEYEARNTLEEVFSFDPGHREANRLWNAWVGRPR
jgi:hypothetical protein